MQSLTGTGYVFIIQESFHLKNFLQVPFGYIWVET